MKKTSQDWMEEFGDTILDPDGWDRSNFEQSWNELITQEEYISRRTRSTCYHNRNWQDVHHRKSADEFLEELFNEPNIVRGEN